MVGKRCGRAPVGLPFVPFGHHDFRWSVSSSLSSSDSFPVQCAGGAAMRWPSRAAPLRPRILLPPPPPLQGGPGDDDDDDGGGDGSVPSLPEKHYLAKDNRRAGVASTETTSLPLLRCYSSVPPPSRCPRGETPVVVLPWLHQAVESIGTRRRTMKKTKAPGRACE